MTTEAMYSVTRRSQAGTLLTVRGDTAAEFAANLDALGLKGEIMAEFGIGGGRQADPIDQAVQNLADQGLNPTTVSDSYSPPQPVQQNAGQQGAWDNPGPEQAAQAQYASPWGQGGQPQPQAQPSGAPGGEQRSCAHGPMTYRAGVSQKTGKPYKAFFCNEPNRDLQCKPQFVN